MIQRTDRVAAQLQQSLACLVAQEVRDPLVGFVTITSVKLAKDLKFAKVFVSFLGDEGQIAQGIQGLKRASGFLRQRLGEVLVLRCIPQLHFVHDTTWQRAHAIELLLNAAQGKQINIQALPSLPGTAVATKPMAKPQKNRRKKRQ